MTSNILTRKRIDEGWRYYQTFLAEQQRRAKGMTRKGGQVRLGEPYDKRTFGFVYEALLNDADIDVNKSTWEQRKDLIRKAVYRSIGYVYDSGDGVERYVSPAQAQALRTAAVELGAPEIKAIEFIYGTDDAVAVIELIKEEYHRLRATGLSGKEAGLVIANQFFGS